jgi:hypothetical protein
MSDKSAAGIARKAGLGSDGLSQRLETPGEVGATVSKSSLESLLLDTSGTWTPQIPRNPLITK